MYIIILLYVYKYHYQLFSLKFGHDVASDEIKMLLILKRWGQGVQNEENALGFTDCTN